MSTATPRKLHHLQRHPLPPADLEDRIVALLESEQLIKPGNRGAATMRMHYAINAAIAAVSILVGFGVGQRMDGETMPAVADGDNEYILLLYEDASYQAPEPGQMEARIGEYSQWARDVADTGKYVGGKKLTNDSVLLMPDGTRRDVIPTAGQGALEGYFVITASNLDEAASIAASCPHLHYGGTVSLRRIAR
jgi:hypothetical protein